VNRVALDLIRCRSVARAATLALIMALPLGLNAADDPAAASKTAVQLDARKAGPRSVENLTERAIVRDYRSAWSSMSHALEFNTLDPLDVPFAGDAKRVLHDTVVSQQRSGVRQLFTDQNHQLEAVFYAPEGDAIELHDTASYQQQVLDGSKSIQDQRVVVHYVVLMTPSADRWVVRQLQVVPQF
jgi:hypothetical protein